jgi:type IV pilus assembly protein PilE
LGQLDQDESGANMKNKYGNRNQGFTVVELMIVLMVIAILVALAYPSYVDYVRKARRGEAEQLLMNWSINQEIWRSNHASYASAADLPKPTHDNYTFPDPTISATAFTLQAQATGDQLNDIAKGDCTLLTLDSAGAKSPPICWGGTGS